MRWVAPLSLPHEIHRYTYTHTSSYADLFTATMKWQNQFLLYFLEPRPWQHCVPCLRKTVCPHSAHTSLCALKFVRFVWPSHYIIQCGDLWLVLVAALNIHLLAKMLWRLHFGTGPLAYSPFPPAWNLEITCGGVKHSRSGFSFISRWGRCWHRIPWHNNRIPLQCLNKAKLFRHRQSILLATKNDNSSHQAKYTLQSFRISISDNMYKNSSPEPGPSSHL